MKDLLEITNIYNNHFSNDMTDRQNISALENDNSKVIKLPNVNSKKYRPSLIKSFFQGLRDTVIWQQFKNANFYTLLLADAALFVLAHIVSYLIRFEFQLDPLRISQILFILPYLVAMKLVLFYGIGLYRGMYRYTSLVDLWNLTRATILATLLLIAFVLYFNRFERFSRSVFLIDGVLTFILAGGHRIAIRLFYTSRQNGNGSSLYNLLKKEFAKTEWKRVLIIGAGNAGEQILREISMNHRQQYHVVGFLDDDYSKKGRSVHGLPIFGSIYQLPNVIKKQMVDIVLIALPSREGNLIRRIVSNCEECDVECKTLPGLGEIIGGVVTVSDFRDVNYQDLLGRRPVKINMTDISDYLTDKVVLVTGCGGSIGSELCRQIMRFLPRKMILIDASEENLFNIQTELHHEFKFKSYETILARVQNQVLINNVFQKYRPDVVFHAAAYKHVPMMEINPWEAFFNNIMGSWTLMEVSKKFGVDRFVLVSTDKAVRPTNVMGASKRVAELLLKSFQGGQTRFMAVRFGNVLGSSGSVVPLFERQIRNGGPVTVTHPEVTRYFMTITEAVQLILQSGSMGRGGEIFVLKMGTPVKIVDMAKDLIRLSNNEPDKDIDIIFTGLREGEKLYEELITEGEDIVSTGHDEIMVLNSNGKINGFKTQEEVQNWLSKELEELKELGLKMEAEGIKQKLKEIVAEYKPQRTKSVLEN